MNRRKKNNRKANCPPRNLLNQPTALAWKFPARALFFIVPRRPSG
jgi:hypothetical protein